MKYYLQLYQYFLQTQLFTATRVQKYQWESAKIKTLPRILWKLIAYIGC